MTTSYTSLATLGVAVSSTAADDTSTLLERALVAVATILVGAGIDWLRRRLGKR